jgi:dTMP kinase
MRPNKFITLEGIEGVGKSTVQTFVCDYLRENQQADLLKTREPGGTPLAERIRELALHTHDEKVFADTELLLMFAARSQHWHGVIKPALDAGKWVVSDRFIDASYAYQFGGRGIAEEKIAILEKLVLGTEKPDFVIVLDAPVDVGMQRARNRSAEDRIEKEKADFFARVRQVYLDRAAKDPERYAVVDASQSLEQVQATVLSILQGVV